MKRKGSVLFLGTLAGVLLALGYGAALLAPAVGLYHDDALYAVTAKALAEDQGYRIISLPNEIHQTKYPVLFPFLLSLVWRVFPSFPENLPWLKLVPFGAAVVWFWLVYRLLKRETGETELAGGIVMLTMLSPRVLHFSTILLSETLFAALAWGSLWLLRSCEREEGSTGHVVLAALATAAAFHTRTIGLVLIVAGVIGLLIVRRVRWALLYGALSVFLVLPWFLWVAAHETVLPDVYSYYTSANYRDWNVIFNFPWAEKVWIVVFNGLALLRAPTWLLGLEYSWLWPIAMLIGLMVIVGFEKDARRGLNVLHIFVLGYVATVLLWAWPSPRFYMPILPLFLLYLAMEGRRLAEKIRDPGRRKLALAVALAALAFPAAARFGRTSILAAEHGLVCPAQPCGDEWREYQVVLSWIEENTPEGAILLSNHDPMVYLYADRKGIGFFDIDPFAFHYAMDSEERNFREPGTLKMQIEQSDADYLMLTRRQDSSWDPVLWSQFRALRAREPHLFDAVVMIGPTPGSVVYRLNRHGEPDGSGVSAERPRDRPAAQDAIPNVDDR